MSNIRKEYFNPNKAKELDGCELECKVVRCYNNGLWKVCPNPDDTKRTQSMKQQCDEGKFIGFEDFCIEKTQFDNKKNWNS